MRHRRRKPVLRAHAADMQVTGNHQQVIEKLERLGNEAERVEDYARAHGFYQAAEHVIRESQ